MQVPVPVDRDVEFKNNVSIMFLYVAHTSPRDDGRMWTKIEVRKAGLTSGLAGLAVRRRLGRHGVRLS